MVRSQDFLDSLDSPSRRVDWRFHRATRLAGPGGRIDPGLDDDWVKRLVKYLRRRNLATTPRGRLGARTTDPGIHGAVELANGPLRVILELRGRILARQPAAETAKQMGLAEIEVEAYGALFYDVASRLGAASYIAWQVIGLSPAIPATLEQRVLMAGWGHGPVALQAALDFYDRQYDPALPQPETGSDAWHSDRAIELAMAVDRIPADATPRAGRDLLRVFPAIFEMIDQRCRPLLISERLARRAQTYWMRNERLAGHAEWMQQHGPESPTKEDEADRDCDVYTDSEVDADGVMDSMPQDSTARGRKSGVA